MEYLSLGLFLIAILIAIYYCATKNHNLFKKHGILHIPPMPLFGNMGSFFAKRSTLQDTILEAYELHPEAKYVGIYESLTPIIVLRDLDLIKSVNMKNFDHFTDHRNFVFKDMDPIFAGMLFSMKGEQWKEQRSILSLAFTSNKVKDMFNLMSECATRYANYLSNLAENEREMEMRDLLTKYTNDVIATCVYGVSVDTIKNPKNVFYTYGKSTTFTSFKKDMAMLAQRNLPWLAKLFQLRFLEKHIAKFFTEQVINTIEERKQNGTYRSDILQLFIDVNDKKVPGKGMSTENMVNHAFSLFFGGTDSVATQTSFLFYLLAENPEILKRLQEEIDETLENNNGQLTYDAIQKMKYLDAMINEAMRLQPITVFLDRLCVKDFELPPALPGEKPFTVKAGMNIWIPVDAIHHDPKHYENPQKFDPDRFLENGKKIINSGAFMPFGLGPRICIGNRFALTEIKVLLCHILAKCNVKIGSKMLLPLQYEEGVITAYAKNGFWLNVEPREHSYCTSQTNGTTKHLSNGNCRN
uniref:Cytochrome P450 9Q6 n=1 Tax=Bombus terrestris audax TaxID=1255228 RepID=A0A4Y5QZQ8_BOMTE|nr:cytochrome P450 9Q6 [Bombus terrestris audax]